MFFVVVVIVLWFCLFVLFVYFLLFVCFFVFFICLFVCLRHTDNSSIISLYGNPVLL